MWKGLDNNQIGATHLVRHFKFMHVPYFTFIIIIVWLLITRHKFLIIFYWISFCFILILIQMQQQCFKSCVFTGTCNTDYETLLHDIIKIPYFYVCIWTLCDTVCRGKEDRDGYFFHIRPLVLFLSLVHFLAHFCSLWVLWEREFRMECVWVNDQYKQYSRESWKYLLCVSYTHRYYSACPTLYLYHGETNNNIQTARHFHFHFTHFIHLIQYECIYYMETGFIHVIHTQFSFILVHKGTTSVQHEY